MAREFTLTNIYGIQQVMAKLNTLNKESIRAQIVSATIVDDEENFLGTIKYSEDLDELVFTPTLEDAL